MRELFLRLRVLFRRRQIERELAEEMESHRAMVQDRLEQSGMSAAEAAAASRKTLGNLTLAREEAREVWIWPSFERLWQDVRYGARTVARQPGLAAAAVATLAIGIGATTTMMSIVGGELWRPLPFQDPARLVSIYIAPAGGASYDRSTGEEIERWRREAPALSAVAAMGPTSRRMLRGRHAPEIVTAQQVTANFFATLGWSPALGRAFGVEDEAATDLEGAAVVLSAAAWRQFFDGDAGVIGQSVVLDDRTMVIAGVLAPNQRLEFTSDPHLFTVVRPGAAPSAAGAKPRRLFNVVARLNAGATIAGARQELRALEGRVSGATPTDPSQGVRVESLADAYLGYNWRPLYFFLGASLFVLVLSCVNVANLLVCRALDRKREFAIRAALGGGRAALIRQLLMEGAWIAGAGTAAGVLCAAWMAQVLSSLIPPGYLLRGGEILLDVRAGAFALAAGAVTTLVFGLVPAFLSRIDLSRALASSPRTIAGGASQRRARRVFVLAEIALAFVLVFGAGLFFESFRWLRDLPLGFDPADRLAMGIPLSGPRYATPGAVAGFADRLIAEVRAIPGVTQASVGSSLPLGSGPSMSYHRADRPRFAPGSEPRGPARSVAPDYFRTLGMRIVAGRAFTPDDGTGAPHVAVINQTLARALFGNANPIGQEIVIAPRSTTWLPEERATVVGVALNSKDVGLQEVEMSSVYVPLAQHPPTSLQLVAHASVPGSGTIDAVRRAVLRVDPALPVQNVSTMTERVANGLRANRFNLVLLGTFAGIALVLAAIGLYGSMSYSTQQRIPELALRHALGANLGGLWLLVARQALTLAVVGVAVGIGVCLVLARAIGDALYVVRGQHEGVIFGVTTTDPATLAVAALAVGAITLAAGALPARRAVGVDPILVLRNE